MDHLRRLGDHCRDPGGLALSSPQLPVLDLLQKYATPLGWIALTAVSGSAFGMMYPGRRLSERDWVGTLRSRFWHGPLGRGLVRLASVGGSARTQASSSHRPTEIAIGLAAQDLFDALPRDVQQRFRELPRVIRALEDEAQAIRTRISKLGNTMADAAVAGQPTSGERERLVTDLQAARERQQQRLAAALSALEAIRLDLLRLSAGVGDPEALTRAIATAQRVGTDVDAMLKAAT